MEFAQEEANLVYEERMGGSRSPVPHEESDEEDGQKELEEMLYSRVYYDDTSINAVSPEAVSSPSTSAPNKTIETRNVARQLGFASSGIDEPTTSMGTLQMQAGCNRSLFNHPSRYKASRYYDNDGNKNSKLTFVAPSNPSQIYNAKNSFEDQSFTRPSEFTTRLMARSTHEKSHRPKVTKFDATVKKVVLKEKYPLVRTSEKALPEPSKDQTVDPVWKPSNSPQSCTSSSLDNSKDSEHSKDTTSDESGSITAHCKGRNELGSVVEKGEVDTADVSKCQKNSSSPSKTMSLRKRPNNQTSEISPRTRKKKQQSFEAKVSKVLSSMLDEESRSSIDETPLISSHSNQNPETPDAESSWSVGMSWADMSSKFSFGVDSIEDESVSSFQLQDGSSHADSRTNTPDLQGKPDELEKDEESAEPTRYQLQLKDPDKESSICQSDSESDVGSVVEVAPPVKPPPPLVDLSDSEFTPIIKENKESSPKKKDITVLFTKQKNTSDSSGHFVIESSSDDDLVILDVIDNSPQNISNPPRVSRGPTKRLSSESNLSANTVPAKRSTVSQTNDETEASTTANELQLLQDCQALLDKPIAPKERSKLDRLDKWLYNPIKSSKFLDHEKHLRKMSDDPKLWNLCQADIVNFRSSAYGPKCGNCNQFGHKTKLCKAPQKVVVCHMCGVPGHSEPRCPKRMCLRCGEKSNIYTDRCKKCVSLDPCKICESKLHVWKSCPDLWRRYHLTTTPGDICKSESVDIRPTSEQWCSNCAGRYHLSHVCRKAQWKCDSITPFIRSYSEISEQQQTIEGPTVVTMLITDDDAKLLSNSNGTKFLDEIAATSKIIIHTSFDIKYKKLVLEGTSLILQETRQKILEWCQEQRKIERDLTEESDLKPPPHKCPVLPKERDRLAIVLSYQLQLLETPGIIDKSVAELYDSLKTTRKVSKEERNKCIRFLNMILVGKCGFGGGQSKINALQTFLKILKGKKGGEICVNSLFKKIQKHFCPIFGYCQRDDFEALIHRFYKSKEFKKFDYQPVERGSDEPSASEVGSPQIIRNVAQKATSQPKKQNLKKSYKTLDLLDEISKEGNQKLKMKVDKFLDIEKTLMRAVPCIMEKLQEKQMKREKQILGVMFKKFCKLQSERGEEFNFLKDIREMKNLVSHCQGICKRHKLKMFI